MKKQITLLLLIFGLKSFAQKDSVDISTIETEIMSILSKFDGERLNSKESFSATILLSIEQKKMTPTIAVSDNIDVATANLLKKNILKNLDINRLFSLKSSDNLDVLIPIYIHVEYRGKKEQFRILDIAKMYSFNGKLYRGNAFIMNPIGVLVVTEF